MAGAEDARRIDGLTRDEICARYTRKVEVIARRVARRNPNGSTMNTEDLVSQGMLGLLEAWDRYDETRGISFGAFAEYRIRGAMMDALRAGDPFSRRRRDLSKKLRDAHRDASRRLGREALPEEIAQELGMSIDDYWQAMDKVQPVTSVSLDGPSAGGEGDDLPLVERIMDASQRAVDHSLFGAEVRTRLREAIVELPERQRQCVLLYYGRDMSQAEIAQVFDVTVSRVSQILTEARERMRRKLSALLEQEGGFASLTGEESTFRDISP